MSTVNPFGFCVPVEGGRYLVGRDVLTVIAIGKYCGRTAVVSRVNEGNRLTFWPCELWAIEYANGLLIGIDATVAKSPVRGFGHWLGYGCLVSQLDGELFIGDLEALNCNE